MRGAIDNPEYFTALAHGRRCRMAEGATLVSLCNLRSVSELARSVLGGEGIESAVEFQRLTERVLKEEMVRLARQASRAEKNYLEWFSVQFQVEEVKLLIRALLTEVPMASLGPWLGRVKSRGGSVRIEGRLAEQIEVVCGLLPRGVLRRALERTHERCGDESRPFYYEAGLDQAYLKEALVRVGALAGGDRDLLEPLVRQEADAFHLRLVVRGKLGYGLEAAALAPFYVAGAGLSRSRWKAMLSESDLRRAAHYAVGKAVDALPSEAVGSSATSEDLEASVLDRLVLERHRRLANRAFRCSHMGFAAFAAYMHLRRLEVTNLARVSEGIRLSVREEVLRRRLVPSMGPEVRHA